MREKGEKKKMITDISTARLLASVFGDKIYNDLIITGKKHIYIDGKKIDLEVKKEDGS